MPDVHGRLDHATCSVSNMRFGGFGAAGRKEKEKKEKWLRAHNEAKKSPTRLIEFFLLRTGYYFLMSKFSNFFSETKKQAGFVSHL
jgi:hypothetical protein